MKKITALFAAAALLCVLCSCKDKPDVSEPVGDVTAPVSEDRLPDTSAPAEAQYLELTEADFAPVDIAMDKTDTAPSMEINSLDLGGFDFGERCSPCKRGDVFEKYLNNRSYDMTGSYSYVNEPENFIDTPCKGMVQSAVFLDDKFYIAVNFDDLCGTHDASLYSLDVKTGKYKELVQHTGLEYNGCFNGLTTAHGRLIYRDVATIGEDAGESYAFATAGSNPSSDLAMVSSTNQQVSSVYSFDPESGEEEKLFELDGSVYGVKATEKGFCVYDTVNAGRDIKNDTYEYDFATGELTEIEPPNYGSDREYLCDGIPAEITGGFDGEKWVPITIKTQYYTLSTDLIKFTALYLWKDMVCIVEDNDYSRDYLHTYDIANREHLKMKFDAYSGGWGEDFQTGDSLMMIGTVTETGYSYKTTCKIEMLVPRLGTIYKLGGASRYIKGKSGDTTYLLAVGEPERSDEGFSTGCGVPERLYWFED